jgi:predicted HTH transcriptional regulator
VTNYQTIHCRESQHGARQKWYNSSDEDKRKIEELTEKKEGRKVVRKKLSEKGCQKTSNKIVALLKKNAKITQNEIAKTLGISRQAVQKHLANLKLAGRLQRIGPDKGGHWEVNV